MKLKLRYYGDPILRKKCDPVEAITPDLHELALNMIKTMDLSQGIGLAAPQIGMPIRLFVLRRYIIQSDEKWDVSDPIIYINPKIVWHSQEENLAEEGCLSIPKVRLSIKRPNRIMVSSMRLDGKIIEEELEGMNARVILHENDHINGVLFIDRAPKRMINRISQQLSSIKRKTLQSLAN